MSPARATDERMSAEAFDALGKLARLPQGEANRAARLVLVGGLSREEAARSAGVSRDRVRVTLWRYAKLRALAKIAAQSGSV